MKAKKLRLSWTIVSVVAALGVSSTACDHHRELHRDLAREHRAGHEELEAEHEAAHASNPWMSRGEHRRLHEELGEEHEDLHEDLDAQHRDYHDE